MQTVKKQDAVENYIEEKKKGRSFEPICAYVYDLNQLRNHAQHMKNSLPPFCKMYYAVKANPAEPLIKSLEPIVDGFEAASLGEINKVNTLTDKPLLFGGPGKKDKEMEAAIKSNVEYVNVESFHELNRIAYIAAQAGVRMPVLLRVNLRKNVSDSHIKMAGVASQFGVDEFDVPNLIEVAKQYKSIEIKGFHFHAMSNNLDAKAHLSFIESCIEKSMKWESHHDLSVGIINVGGGIGINYGAPEAPFDWEILSVGLESLYQKYKSAGFTMILEIGRYMVAECGSYVAEVLDVKKNHDKNYAVIRGGSHHLRLPAAWKMSHPFKVHEVDAWSLPFERPGLTNEKVTIAGELCTPNDVLVREEHVETVRVGDVVIFQYAGAYGWTISHHDFLSHEHPEHVFME